MDGANKPPELDPGHDELHALVSFGRGGPVVEQKQDSGHHLDGKEEEGHAAEVVPERAGVDRDGLVRDELLDRSQAQPFIQPSHAARRPAALFLERRHSALLCPATPFGALPRPRRRNRLRHVACPQAARPFTPRPRRRNRLRHGAPPSKPELVPARPGAKRIPLRREGVPRIHRAAGAAAPK